MFRSVNPTRPYHTLVVPLDGSPFAERAVPTAAAVARRAQGIVHLVRVHVPPVASSEDVPEDLRWDEALRVEERDFLDAAARTLADEWRVCVETALLEGNVAPAIDAYAREVGADLIVMTSHGRTGMSRAWLGSTADRLAREATVPVLMLRIADDGAGATGAAPPGRFLHVLVPLDGSEGAEEALEEAARFGTWGVRYTLVRVVRPSVRWRASRALARVARRGGAAGVDVAAGAEAYVRAVGDRLRARGEGAEVEVVGCAAEHVAPALLERARLAGADLVVLAPRGRGAARFLGEGIADQLLRGTTCAVLLCGPHAGPGEDPGTISGH